MVMGQNPSIVLYAGRDQVTGGGTSPGWISGDVAGLAAGQTTTVIFDLGPNWADYVRGTVMLYLSGPTVASGASAIWNGNDLSAPNRERAIAFNGTTSSFVTTITPPNWGGFTFVIHGRYVFITVTNADATLAYSATSYVRVTAHNS
jgi:hypothetical protein